MVALDLFQQVKDRIGWVGLELVGLVVPFLVDFGVEAEDFKGDMHGLLLRDCVFRHA